MSRRLPAADLLALGSYLRRTAGLELDEARRPGLSAVVLDRLAATGQPDVAHYLRMLDAPGGAAERQRLLDEVTIQETHFHRGRPQIDALRRHLLPELLARAAAERRELVVWSAGCATGEEPYTLAMLLLEVAATLPDPPPVRVVGTDVSTAALEVARAATYSGRTVALAEPEAVQRWLHRDPDGTHVVRDEVRRLVHLQHHNLVTDPPPFPAGGVDLVVCRHVTIYFSRDTTRAVVTRFRQVLAPGGWLLLGPAETLWQVSEEFATVQLGDAFAYRPARAQRPGGPRRARPLPPPTRAARPVAPRPAAVRPAAADPGATLAGAHAAFDAGDYEAAAVAAAALTATGTALPDDLHTAALCLLGHARLNRGDPVAAVAPLQRAVYLDPRAGHAHFLLAVALAGAGKARPAAASYRAAAATLAGAPTDAVRRILDGRQVEELVQLCRRLADDADVAGGTVRRGA